MAEAVAAGIWLFIGQFLYYAILIVAIWLAIWFVCTGAKMFVGWLIGIPRAIKEYYSPQARELRRMAYRARMSQEWAQVKRLWWIPAGILFGIPAVLMFIGRIVMPLFA